jgi:hypothetical protein
LVLGNASDGPAGDKQFDGLMDDVQIYDYALNADLIGQLYEHPGSVIPEPTTLSLLALGGLAALRRRRRR